MNETDSHIHQHDGHRPVGLARVLASAFSLQMMLQLLCTSPAVFAPVVAPALGVGEHWMGILLAMMGITGVVTSTTSSALFGRFGLVRFTQFGALLTSLAMLLAALAQPWLMFVAALLLGVAIGPSVPACAYLVSRTAPPKKLGFAMSIQQTGPPLGLALGGALIPALILMIGWQWTLAVLAIPGIALTLYLQPIRQRIDHGIKTGVNVAWHDVISPLKLAVSTPKLRELCIAAVGLTTLHQGFISFIIIYLTLELHLGLVAAGMILAASQITAIAGRLFWGWLGDRTHDAFLVLAIIILGASALYVGLAFYPRDLPIWPVAVISILLGGTVASWQGLFFAANARSAPPGKVVSAVGGVQFFLFVGGSGGPVVIATVVSITHDYRIVYGLLALLAAWLGARLLRLRRTTYATS